MAATHAMARAGDSRAARYRTAYYDTPDLRALADHLDGRTPRHKVRVRDYQDRGLVVLEVKTRSAGGVTRKRRVERAAFGDPLSAPEVAWASELTGRDAAKLAVTARTRFRRLTLVGIDHIERVTVDLDLVLEARGVVLRGDSHVLVEVKRPPGATPPPALAALLTAGAVEGASSKYVAAMAGRRP